MLTKADLFWDRLPDDLLDYMKEDPVWAACRMEGVTVVFSGRNGVLPG